MPTTNLKQEEYTAIADFMLQSFERDQSEFLKYYKAMDAAFLAEFKAANEQLKKKSSGMMRVKQLKSTTKTLYTLLDEIKKDVIFLKDYALKAKLEVDSLTKIVKQLTSRNAEGVVKMLRETLPYYEQHTSEMTNMPDGFLTVLKDKIEQIETLNATQDNTINEKKGVTSTNRGHHKELYAYISEVARAGKRIFEGTSKADEYVIQRVVGRMRAAKKNTAAENK